MKIRRYTGKSMSEVIEQVKAELGADAVILETRHIEKKKLPFFKRKPMVEVLAAKGVNVPPRRPAARKNPLLEKAYGAAPPEPTLSQPAPPPPAPAAVPAEAIKDIEDIKAMLRSLQERVTNEVVRDTSEAILEQYSDLVNASVYEQLAGTIVRNIESQIPVEHRNDPLVVQEAIRGTIRSMISEPSPIQLNPSGPTVVCFIGPTGVGKTTTICKLAARYAHIERKRVGLITVDTYRIAAVEQLRRVAELVRIPVETVEHDDDPILVRTAIEKFSDRDVILIDTAGRSQHDQDKMDELKNLLDTVQPHEVHLVLSLTAGNLDEVIEEFTRYRVDHVILTKLDEISRYGLILNVLHRVDRSLSYVTTGQSIPVDIEVADPGRISNLICGNGATHG
jgi:flagellar biosynthesis protein FlhF